MIGVHVRVVVLITANKLDQIKVMERVVVFLSVPRRYCVVF